MAQASSHPTHRIDRLFPVGMSLFHYIGAINDPRRLPCKVPTISTLAQWPSWSFPQAQKCRCGSRVQQSPAAPGRYCRWWPTSRSLVNNQCWFRLSPSPNISLSVSPNPRSLMNGEESGRRGMHPSARLLAAPAPLRACGFRSLSTLARWSEPSGSCVSLHRGLAAPDTNWLCGGFGEPLATSHHTAACGLLYISRNPLLSGRASAPHPPLKPAP